MTENLPQTNNNNNDDAPLTLDNIQGTSNNTNNTSIANNNIEHAQGYNSDDNSHVPFINNDMEELFDEDLQNYWIPTGIMAELTTNIYKGNSLLQHEHQTFCMSKQAHNTDKVLSKLAYKFSSSLCLLDLVIKQIYKTKLPDEDQDGIALWKYLEEALLSTRLLILDALSVFNISRRDEALKSFMPSHQLAPETDFVFGEELQEIIEKGNREVKFFNNAFNQ
ncbi:74_t:CDS:2 [Scutellospora calospora]|uniref:74_t:CDS:1 n=1 Tax=Scutellospora calospora TaxID=85575 RepID=A0ACA9K3K3_9GLOM|nr:74_t:CDS:2 [Scutellospora calospora]